LPALVADGWPRRLLTDVAQAALIMVIVAVLVFLIIRLIPGDPAQQVLGQKATPRAVAALRHQLGLDRSLPSQLWSYFSGLLHGRLGNSLVEQGVSVDSLVISGLGVTLTVVASTVLISVAVGVPIGLWSVLSKLPGADVGVRGLSVLLLASPPFFVGLLLILVFSLELRVAPAGGWGSGWPGDLKYLLLPALALSGYLGPVVVRAVRQAALHASRQPFVEATLARGVSPRRVVLAHILPNSLLPLVTLVGLNIGWLISGAVVVEAVFALPGLGQVLAQAVSELDYTVIQGVAIVSAFVVVVANLLADVSYAAIDPRIRHGR
jgi:peptide/nickel transport system permease protein